MAQVRVFVLSCDLIANSSIDKCCDHISRNKPDWQVCNKPRTHARRLTVVPYEGDFLFGVWGGLDGRQRPCPANWATSCPHLQPDGCLRSVIMKPCADEQECCLLASKPNTGQTLPLLLSISGFVSVLSETSRLCLLDIVTHHGHCWRPMPPADLRSAAETKSRRGLKRERERFQSSLSDHNLNCESAFQTYHAGVR